MRAKKLKDEEHLCRSRSTTNIKIKVEDSIHLNIKQSEFLANTKNKICLIYILVMHLQRGGYTVHQAWGNANLLIVLTAVDEGGS